jgi:hypothetical protein
MLDSGNGTPKTAKAVKNDGTSENYVSRSDVEDLQKAGANLEIEDDGWMVVTYVETANANVEDVVERRQRVSLSVHAVSHRSLQCKPRSSARTYSREYYESEPTEESSGSRGRTLSTTSCATTPLAVGSLSAEDSEGTSYFAAGAQKAGGANNTAAGAQKAGGADNTVAGAKKAGGAVSLKMLVMKIEIQQLLITTP